MQFFFATPKRLHRVHSHFFMVVLGMAEGGFLLPELLAALTVDLQRHSRSVVLRRIIRHLLHSTAKAHSVAHKITAAIEIHAQRRIFFLFVLVLALKFDFLHGILYEIQFDKLKFERSKMQTIQLKAMTRELCHELYRHWTNDASIYMDMRLFQPYVYDEAAVNRYFDAKGQDASRRLFAIMLGDTVVGELQLKQIDHDKKECTLSIHMQNDAVKGKGYGTQAECLAVKIAFDELGMAAVNADTVMKNTRSQHVLEKAGFRFVGEDGTFKYYRIER